jgi:hypothetical protein
MVAHELAYSLQTAEAAEGGRRGRNSLFPVCYFERLAVRSVYIVISQLCLTLNASAVYIQRTFPDVLLKGQPYKIHDIFS